jgi:TatD DNase family protein
MIFPLDAHAHIEPDIAAEQLVALRSCVIAVTRTLSEYEKARDRLDSSVVWGVGCHPGLAREVKGFSASRLQDAIATTPIIGEIGLDGAASTPMDAQLAALREVLKLAAATPRVLSLHSSGPRRSVSVSGW